MADKPEAAPPATEPAAAGAEGAPVNAVRLNLKSKLHRALDPLVAEPLRRRLRIYASDPSLATGLDTYSRNVTLTDLPWEELEPGPIGEYLEVVDYDPASQCAYAPVNLDNPYLLHEHGLAPSETDPRFHQQMVYAVASRTIEAFERALGRPALWASTLDDDDVATVTGYERAMDAPEGDESAEAKAVRLAAACGYVQRLRIYPHAIRAANAYYSPAKKALLLGYFSTSPDGDAGNGASTMVFAALSHDIVAHETAHALLDGLHRRFIEPTNDDVLAFHEAFADIVAMFLHFTLPDAVRPEIAATRGDLFTQNRLGEIAVQFGQSLGQRGALRDYIGTIGPGGVWQRREPRRTDYASATEAHDRGAVLVAAVFDAFLQIYQVKAREWFRLATGGTGEIEPGELAPMLVDTLAKTACEIAGHFLNIVIRALDYCPPFDLNFGEFLRAIITADRDLVPDDARGYRVAITQAFRARGISPSDVRSVSPDTLAWETPDLHIDFADVIADMHLEWQSDAPCRRDIYLASRNNAKILREWLINDAEKEHLQLFGIYRHEGPLAFTVPKKKDDGTVEDTEIAGQMNAPLVHSVRLLRRVGPDSTIHTHLIAEITQVWKPDDAAAGTPGFRGGCTLIIDRATGRLRYVIRKRIDSTYRYRKEFSFAENVPPGLREAYFTAGETSGEPFAMLHTSEFA